MIQLQINLQHLNPFVEEKDLQNIEQEIVSAKKCLDNKTGKGNDFLGWVDLPSTIEKTIIDSIKKDADEIRKKAQLYVVIGIGGSYLGARAIIEALQNPFNDLLKDRKNPLVIYAGHTMSEDYMADLLKILDQYDYALTVISKSGTTTEPALAFRILKNHIEQKYGKQEAASRIIAVTDEKRGALKKLADEEGYKTYVIPDNVGGRYSVLTPVGLLPIAVAGFDIEKLINGAVEMQKYCFDNNTLKSNIALQYVAARNVLYRKGKKVEILVNYLPNLVYMTEWWKQLYGESEGKEGKGIFPAGVSFTTDLHSMGQYIQEGERMLFETVLSVEKSKKSVKIPTDPDNKDGLNFLTEKTITEINHKAELGTALAHLDGGVPNMKIMLPEISESILGQLIYFFEYACGLSGYVLDVNPFDQPGVEAYKKNMFALLGKPGFEKETEEIQKRINK
ncbi:glucose-6-phosphate isomerase [Bacteroidales bacterium OttesenSCG-928-C19]|nr:glucose-6-phosphate isomerase [Bacteroidales bacterium OttesenSCG-928-C19]